MRKQLSTALLTLSSAAARLARRIARRPAELSKVRRDALTRWYADKGDAEHRLNFPSLDADSIVFDVGGHVGQWASELYCRYSCQIYVFEPVIEHLAELRRRFLSNPRVQIEPVGLSGASRSISISCEGVESSVYKNDLSTNRIEVKLVDVFEFCQANSIHRIDLMKINIEGGEFELLDRIVETGLISKVALIHIQFHDFVPNADQLVVETRLKLERTHECKWVYPYVWECWTEKNRAE